MKAATAILALCLIAGTAHAAMEVSFRAPMTGDYSDPYTGPCASGDENITITGLAGAFCSPKCTSSGGCPTDLPSGCSAQAECVLETPGSSKPTMCALICTPGQDDSCGKGASCKPIQGTGVCTYNLE